MLCSALYLFFSRFGRGGADFEKFYLDSLLAMAAGVTPLGQQVQSLVTTDRLDLLAAILSVLPNAEGFNKHNPGLHENNGLRKDNRGHNEESLVRMGGSIEELDIFISKAKSSAEQTVVINPLRRFLIPATEEQARERAEKRKINTETRFLDEIKDKGGIERKYSNSFMGSIDVNVDLLEVDPILQPKVKYLHVAGIKQAMLLRFDPSLLSIVVRPLDVSKFDANNPQLSKYYVIQGVNSFQAIKDLKKEGKIHRLQGLGGGLVTVTLVNIEDTDLIHYGHLRGNSLASVFITKPGPQVGYRFEPI